MSEPTEAQIKEFWKWCGLFYGWSDNPETMRQEGGWYAELQTPRGCMLVGNELPPIDLNNLFKYAVPNARIKAIFLGTHFNYIEGIPTPGGFEVSIMWDKMDNTCTAIDEDPALALFWALWQVKEKSNE